MAETKWSNSRTFKLVLVGDSGVGKTCFVERAARNYFAGNTDSTIGAAFQTVKLDIDEKTTVTYNIWDTAGQERYRSLAPIYYRGSHVAIIVYDITDRSSFDNINTWLFSLKSMLGSSVLIALVGNKCDLEHRRDVDYKLAKQFANKNSLMFAEVSAKNASNVALLFHTITKELLKLNIEPEVTAGFSVSNDSENKTKIRSCKC